VAPPTRNDDGNKHQPQSEQTHTLAMKRKEREKGTREIAYINLSNKKVKNMKLAYNFQRCRPFCLRETDEKAKRNEMNEICEPTARSSQSLEESLHTHLYTHASKHKSRKHQI